MHEEEILDDVVQMFAVTSLSDLVCGIIIINGLI